MSWELFAVAAGLSWAAGMTAASILYRRGHDGWHWMLVCVVAGPLAALLVADQARFVEPQATPLTLTRGTILAAPAGTGDARGVRSDLDRSRT